MKKIHCLNCGKVITNEKIYVDILGRYVVCKNCNSSTDI
jgi:DNA-directed RNA polymerase subunit RPC12/RpoP